MNIRDGVSSRFVLAFLTFFTCIHWVSAQSVDYEDLYWRARTANLYQVAYTDESAKRLHSAYMAIDLNNTINEILDKIRQPDEEFQVKLEALHEAYESLEQVAKYDEVTYDLWEGHDELPIPNGGDPNGYDTAIGALADSDGFRPFLADFRLNNPRSAKGTVIAVPSVRTSYSELTAMARVFNDMDFNVFTVLPRLDMIGGIDGLNWIMLQLDAQRAIRYVKYHAEKFSIDPNRIALIAGSKGNLSHPTTYQYFDRTPTELSADRGATLPGYLPDDIDRIPSTVNVSIVSYGTMALGMLSGGRLDEGLVTQSRIYSKENFDKGHRFPNIVLLAGTLDSDAANLSGAIDALYSYNNLEDKLYTVNYEAHLLNNIPHGFGSGLQYPNLKALWSEVGIFIESCFNEQ